MRLGIFGGTFDPIHLGHLILAEQCRDACGLDRVLFVPAGRPPHKQKRRVTSGKLRKEMVELAISGNPNFSVSAIELDRDEPSYSANTLGELAKQNPDAELFLLIGSDSLHHLPHWYQPKRIISLATPVIGTRPGSELPNLRPLQDLLGAADTEEIQQHLVEVPLVHISSSLIRGRTAVGKSIRYLVPRAVECFIETNKLYR